ncbi:MAG: sulfotransferase family protein [Myxococcota bacterium]
MKDVGWRDAGIRSALLRLLNAGGQAATHLGLRWPSFEPDSLIAQATRETGLSDFGEASFREGLDVLADSIEREAGLSSFGRIVVRAQLVANLVTRLRVFEWAKRHPEVRDERIERPFVILGLPRTGTTLLSFLLDLDPTHRSLLAWEAQSPVPPPELSSVAEDPRIAETARRLAGSQRLMPWLEAMHPMGATLPTECVTLFMLEFRSLQIETQVRVPRYQAWLEGADMRPAFAVHRLVLQILQSRLPTERWALKTPQHLWCLPALCEAYPGARLIWTHRDPAAVVGSVASLNQAFYRTWARDPDPRLTGAYWNRHMATAVARGLAFDAAQGGRGWCHHLHYAELMKDPLVAMDALYASFGERVTPLHRRRMQAWMRNRPQSAFGRHRYELADFGLEREVLGAQYAAYRERFEVPLEP